MTDYEIDQIIEYAESNQPDEYTSHICNYDEDIRLFERQVRQGMIEVDEI
ncbi:MAG: hypothetical protein WC332_00255 [Clostridia bacterium]|jgi:hypothetical protein